MFLLPPVPPTPPLRVLTSRACGRLGGRGNRRVPSCSGVRVAVPSVDTRRLIIRQRAPNRSRSFRFQSPSTSIRSTRAAARITSGSLSPNSYPQSSSGSGRPAFRPALDQQPAAIWPRVYAGLTAGPSERRLDDQGQPLPELAGNDSELAETRRVGRGIEELVLVPNRNVSGLPGIAVDVQWSPPEVPVDIRAVRQLLVSGRRKAPFG